MFYVEEISEILEKDPKEYSKDDILELAQYDVFVHTIMRLEENGYINWEQALIYCVLILSKSYAMALEKLFDISCRRV